MNATLGSEVNKLQKQLDLVRSKQDGEQLTTLQDELEMLREQLQEASAQKKEREKEHSSEKMKLEKVRPGGVCVHLDTRAGHEIPKISEVRFCVFMQVIKVSHAYEEMKEVKAQCVSWVCYLCCVSIRGWRN